VRSVTTALEVLREASPVVAEQVQRGELAVSRAVKLLKAVPDKRKQTTIANKGKDAIADALGENEPLEITEAVKRLRDHVFSTIERYPKHGLRLAPDHLRQVADEIDVGVKNGHFPESAAVVGKATAPEPDEPADGWCLICGSTANCDCAEKFGSPAEVLGQRDVDEPALVTCRYCHRQVEPDEDGACPRCREPDVDKDDAGPAEIAPPPQSSNRAAKGVGLAHQAINALCGIPKTDGQRERAFEMVADFIEANSPRASSSAWQEARTLVSELGELVNQPAFNVPIRSVKARVRKLHKILGLEYGKGAKQ